MDMTQKNFFVSTIKTSWFLKLENKCDSDNYSTRFWKSSVLSLKSLLQVLERAQLSCQMETNTLLEGIVPCSCSNDKYQK